MKTINIDQGTKYKNNIDLQNKNTSHYKIFDFINQSDIVLDVGCACGDLGYVLHTHKHCTVYGLEYNKKSIEIAHTLNIYKKIWQCDLNNFSIEQFTNIYNFFDCIVCGDILEHLYNPSEVLLNLLKFLKPNGYIVISIPNVGHSSIKAQLLDDNFIYTETGLLDNTHIRFFTKNSIPTFLANLNMEITQCEFTTSNFYGTYSKEIYKNINTFSLFCIYKNKFSHIFQFVIKCTNSKKIYEDLVNINKAKINNVSLKNHSIDFKFFIKNLLKIKIFNNQNNLSNKIYKFYIYVKQQGFKFALKKVYNHLK